MGKGWSKGLTAARDARVAKNAARHVGMTYRIRPKSVRPWIWTSDLAYVVGLIATDGCLVNDGRHIAFTTNDRQLADTFLTCLGRPNRYGMSRTSAGNSVCRVQIGDVSLYRWLLTIGLTPRKSLTLGAVDVPDEFFMPFVRGLLDGDGTIYTLEHAPTPSTYPGYRYERLWTFFSSASRAHIDWLRARIRDRVGIDGYLTERHLPGRHPFFTLKYGKHGSIKLLGLLYDDPAAPRLERKFEKWRAFAARHSLELPATPT